MLTVSCFPKQTVEHIQHRFTSTRENFFRHVDKSTKFCLRVPGLLTWGNGVSEDKRTFSGLRSQCTIWREWRCFKAIRICRQWNIIQINVNFKLLFWCTVHDGLKCWGKYWADDPSLPAENFIYHHRARGDATIAFDKCFSRSKKISSLIFVGRYHVEPLSLCTTKIRVW
jgi:hypothetical protein